MSVDGHVLGAGTVVGVGAGAVSNLTNTGDPLIVGTIAAIVLIVVAGFIARSGR